MSPRKKGSPVADHPTQTLNSLVRRGLARKTDRMPWLTYVVTAKAHRLIEAIEHAEWCMVDWDGESRGEYSTPRPCARKKAEESAP